MASCLNAALSSNGKWKPGTGVQINICPLSCFCQGTLSQLHEGRVAKQAKLPNSLLECEEGEGQG